MTIYFNSVEDLEKLPQRTVILDDDREVWQKDGRKWYTPGDEWGNHSGALPLPAKLLDDGL